jgi:hypothetical protein
MSTDSVQPRRLTIGVPRALDHYAHFPLVRELLVGLGFGCVVSEPTNRAVVDAGTSYTVSDACIPVKIFHGHVESLFGRCDALYLPRLVKLRRLKHDGRSFRETFCPKFIGLPDIVRNSMGLETIEQLGPAARARRALKRRLRLREGEVAPGVRELPVVQRGQGGPGLDTDRPIVLDIDIDLTKRLGTLYRVANQLRRLRFFSYTRLYLTYRRALRVQRRYENLLGEGLSPREALAVIDGAERPERPPTSRGPLAVVGYPYLLYDRFLAAGVVERFYKRGYDVWTPWRLWKDKRALALGARVKSRPLFWHFSNIVCDAGLYLMRYGLTPEQLAGERLSRRAYLYRRARGKPGAKDTPIRGLVHVTSATCGPDAFVGKYLELAAKRLDIPLMVLQVDEQSGEAGVLTRLEAFCDMLERR